MAALLAFSMSGDFVQIKLTYQDKTTHIKVSSRLGHHLYIPAITVVQWYYSTSVRSRMAEKGGGGEMGAVVPVKKIMEGLSPPKIIYSCH